MDIKESIIDDLEKAISILDNIESVTMKDGRSYITVYICSSQMFEELKNHIHYAKLEAEDVDEVKE